MMMMKMVVEESGMQEEEMYEVQKSATARIWWNANGRGERKGKRLAKRRMTKPCLCQMRRRFSEDVH